MKIKVIYSVWGGDGFDSPLGGGVHELEGVTDEQARSIAAAAAAGVVEVVEATDAERRSLEPHVQSQEDGEAAWQAAQGDWVEPEYELTPHGERLSVPGYWTGGWSHGNLVTFVAAAKDKLLADDMRRTGAKGVDPAPLLKDGERETVERQIALAEAALEKIEVPS